MLQNFKSGYEVSSKSEIARSEKNDCVVRAIANAFKVNYDMAHVFVKENFVRKNGKGTHQTNTKLKQLAKSPIELDPLTERISINQLPIQLKHLHKNSKQEHMFY